MSEIVDFIKENIKEIVIIVVVVLFLLVLININGIDLNAPKPESKLVQQVTVEAFSIDSIDSEENIQKMMVSPSENFCESYLGNTIELDKACNQLTESNCSDVRCCVYGNGKCMAGDVSGPIYKTDKDGKLITMDSYYYLGKCRGSVST
jgi:hypothetical protein